MSDTNVDAAAVARRNEEKAKLKDGTIQQGMRDRLDGDAAFSSRVESAWAQVAQAVHERSLEQDPAPKNFEVHHALEVSKDAFLICLHETDDIDQAREAGISRTAPPVVEQENKEDGEACPAP
ncbi:hypothetical protein ACGYLO_10505 [Sulfitobacter sp. 1A13353]|uniref:hypothetical protein n=1 Tax=Sulfitobacter sp. 1A13353 TaxID=3368568 RepID=UPI00374744F9